MTGAAAVFLAGRRPARAGLAASGADGGSAGAAATALAARVLVAGVRTGAAAVFLAVVRLRRGAALPADEPSELELESDGLLGSFSSMRKSLPVGLPGAASWLAEITSGSGTAQEQVV